MSLKEKDKNGKSFFGKVGETIRGSKTKERPKLVDADNNGNNSWLSHGDNKDYDSPSPLLTPHFDVAALSQKEIEVMFEKMLDDMNLKEDQKKPLRDAPLEQKRFLLSQKIRTEQTARGAKVKYDSPSDYVKILSQPVENPEKLQRVLESLRVSLSNNTVSWIQNFGPRGLNLLLETLKYLSSEIIVNADDLVIKHAQHECIKCLKAFMNNRYGLFQMFDNSQGFMVLVQSLTTANTPAMVDTVRLLAAVSVVEQKNGHSRVLEAFTVVGEIEQRERFLPIVLGLYEEQNNSLQDACLQFINAVTLHPDDVDFRIHLRNEFMRCGLIDILDNLVESEFDDVKRQIEFFMQHRDNDADDISLRLDNVKSEFDTPGGCFELLLNRLADTPAEPYFLSLLQHCLLVRDDVVVRSAYFKLLDEIVSQVVLQKNGVDPDFRSHKRFHLDVDDVIDRIIDKSQSVDKLFAENGGASGEVRKKLDMAVTAKQETEAKLSQYYSKIEEYQKEADALRQHILANHGEPPVPSTLPIAAPFKSAPPPGIPPPPPLPPGFGGSGPIRGPPPAPPLPGIPPPPPLPGVSGGPRPPPPPPLPGGGPPLPPGAPPPPGLRMPGAPVQPQMPSFLKPKTAYKPDVTLKKLNWKAVAPQSLTQQAFWSNVREDRLGSPDLFDDLQKTFASGVALKEKDVASSGVVSDGVSKKSQKKAKELKVLDGKSAQTLAILQGSLKMSHDDLRRAILEIDETKLSDSVLQQLISTLPEGDQMNKLNSFKDNVDDLAEAEVFALKIGSIKRIKPRLQAIIFKLKFTEMLNDIKPDIVAVKEACDEVRTSEGFSTFLELVLLIGNYMNSGSKNSGVYAFDIHFLTKLCETKALDNRNTLLHFLANSMEQKYQKICNFTQDFIHVSQAARVAPDILQKNLNAMQQSIKKLETDLKTHQSQEDYDKFGEIMSRFLEESRDVFTVLENMYKNMQELYKDLGKYFAFDPQKYGVDEFFGDLKTFKEQYELALKDNAKLRETEEKIRRAKDAKAQAEKEKKDRQEQRNKIMKTIGEGGDQEGVMDTLLEALSNGQAFPQRAKTPGKRTPRSAGDRKNVVRQRSRQELTFNSTNAESITTNGNTTVEANNALNTNSVVASANSETGGGQNPAVKQAQMKVRRKGKPTVLLNQKDAGADDVTSSTKPGSPLRKASKDESAVTKKRSRDESSSLTMEELLEKIKAL